MSHNRTRITRVLSALIVAALATRARGPHVQRQCRVAAADPRAPGAYSSHVAAASDALRSKSRTRAAGGADFIARGPNYAVYLSGTHTTLVLAPSSGARDSADHHLDAARGRQSGRRWPRRPGAAARDHTFVASASDVAGNGSQRSVTFRIVATIPESIAAAVNAYVTQGSISGATQKDLLAKLQEKRLRRHSIDTGWLTFAGSWRISSRCARSGFRPPRRRCSSPTRRTSSARCNARCKIAWGGPFRAANAGLKAPRHRFATGHYSTRSKYSRAKSTRSRIRKYMALASPTVPSAAAGGEGLRPDDREVRVEVVGDVRHLDPFTPRRREPRKADRHGAALRHQRLGEMQRRAAVEADAEEQNAAVEVVEPGERRARSFRESERVVARDLGGPGSSGTHRLQRVVAALGARPGAERLRDRAHRRGSRPERRTAAGSPAPRRSRPPGPSARARSPGPRSAAWRRASPGCQRRRRRRASVRTTAGAPPTTQPIALSEEWTIRVVPGSTPIAARSRRSIRS